MAKPVYPCLWFNNNALEAAEFYCSIFENSRILDKNEIAVTFELGERKILAINGGPVEMNFNESVSLVVECADQDEIDYFWEKLTSDGGEESMCGWLKDKYGFSWQIVPEILNELMRDPSKRQRVVEAFLKMKKFDIEKLIDSVK